MLQMIYLDLYNKLSFLNTKSVHRSLYISYERHFSFELVCGNAFGSESRGSAIVPTIGAVSNTQTSE